jgi:hypothetical protein
LDDARWCWVPLNGRKGGCVFWGKYSIRARGGRE